MMPSGEGKHLASLITSVNLPETNVLKCWPLVLDCIERNHNVIESKQPHLPISSLDLPELKVLNCSSPATVDACTQLNTIRCEHIHASCSSQKLFHASCGKLSTLT